MASFASRSLRSASRMVLQTTGSQGGRISSQAVRRHCKLQSIQALHQAAGVSLAKQAQKQFVVSISRTVSSCTLITTAAPLSASVSLCGAGISSDIMEGSSGDDDGLVIEARKHLDDL
ncbi:unnamed protein product [Porites lobata]|uniref:Uncharacterized protein n=1 Tax=Porites lobata TaxID=104759 RepID=A0ABN8PP13_9CNID|nr:unnamed protein product [Porites lobata]